MVAPIPSQSSTRVDEYDENFEDALRNLGKWNLKGQQIMNLLQVDPERSLFMLRGMVEADDADLTKIHNVICLMKSKLGELTPEQQAESFTKCQQRARDKKYIGILNQGATCYLNSLLQTLFHLPLFRAETYAIEVKEEVLTIPLALQKLFFALETSTKPVQTRELTKSFGWDTHDSYVQHDVQELLRKLLDSLNRKQLQEMFYGKMLGYVQCIDVEYISVRQEDFADIQLSVKNMRGLVQSFDDYVKKERLEGKNQYELEKDGVKSKCDADKGSIFRTLPTVLTLHLRRFEYNYYTNHYVKVYDRYEYSEEINLSDYIMKNGSPLMEKVVEAERAKDGDKYCEVDYGSQDWTYVLQSVLVHSGTASGGHYYAYVRPDAVTNPNEWIKFNDSIVSSESVGNVFERNFGGSTYEPTAYVLVYVRKCKLNEVCFTLTDEHRPENLRRIVEEEERQQREEEDRRERQVTFFAWDWRALASWMKKENRFSLQHFPVQDAPYKIIVRKENSVATLKEEMIKVLGGERSPEKIQIWTNASMGKYGELELLEGQGQLSDLRGLQQISMMDAREFVYVEDTADSVSELIPAIQGTSRWYFLWNIIDEVSMQAYFLGGFAIPKKVPIIDLLPAMLRLAVYREVMSQMQADEYIEAVTGKLETEIVVSAAFEKMSSIEAIDVNKPFDDAFREGVPLNGSVVTVLFSKRDAKCSDIMAEIKSKRYVRFLPKNRHQEMKTEVEALIKDQCENREQRAQELFEKLDGRVITVQTTDPYSKLQEKLAKAYGIVEADHIRILAVYPRCAPFPFKTSYRDEETLVNEMLYKCDREENYLCWELVEIPVSLIASRKEATVVFTGPDMKSKHEMSCFLKEDIEVREFVAHIADKVPKEVIESCGFELDHEGRGFSLIALNNFGRIAYCPKLGERLLVRDIQKYRFQPPVPYVKDVEPDQQFLLEIAFLVSNPANSSMYPSYSDNFHSPFHIYIASGTTLKMVEEGVKEKLSFPKEEMASWRYFACGVESGAPKEVKKADDLFPIFENKTYASNPCLGIYRQLIKSKYTGDLKIQGK